MREENCKSAQCLSEDPSLEETYKFSKICLRKKRMKKKFLKKLYRYLPQNIYREYLTKAMVKLMLRPRINYSELAGKLVVVEPLPQGALPKYEVKT